MATLKQKRSRINFIAIVSLLFLLLVGLHLMSSAIQDSEKLSGWFIPLLIFTVIGLIILLLFITVNVKRLLKDYRAKKVGSRLTLRMVIMFIVLSLAPVSVVYYYSLNFLLIGIDSWFDAETDKAMDDALDLSKASLVLHKKQLLDFSRQMLNSIQDSSQAGMDLTIEDLILSSGAADILLMNENGRVLSSSSADPTLLISATPDLNLIKDAVDGNDFVGVFSSAELNDIYIRCVVGNDRGFVLQVLYPTSDRINKLSERVQSAYEKYNESAYLRQSIKFSFTLTLSLVLLVGILAAVLMAFYISRLLVAPISSLARGTQAVADGDYDHQLIVPQSHNELSFLVSSFNAMTRRISIARLAEERSKLALATQHQYLEALLDNMSSGVIALDAEGNVKTANAAAQKILDVDLALCIGKPIKNLSVINPQLEDLFGHSDGQVQLVLGDARKEVVLERDSGRQVILCSRSILQDEGSISGYVMLLDDITVLVQAQRNAAWGEVARRLAHEIKNPLTPIQLSAERLRRKYLKILPEEDSAVLDKATTTIVNQVTAMKTMVDAFSDYAKPSKVQVESVVLDDFINDVLALYDGTPALTFKANAGHTRISVDPVSLRQVIHNLVKNALEAIADLDGGCVTLTTLVDQENKQVEIRVTDNGPGIDASLLNEVFDPYVTSKTKGTGLGLAVVKKIVEEHGGTINAVNVPVGGLEMTVKLPTEKY